MATFTKAHLSGAADGLAVKVAATSSTGTTIHTAVAGTTAGTFDEIWIWATNTSTSPVKLTIEWGTTTAADGNIEVTVPAEQGLMQVIPGLILHNTKVVTAFAGTANVICLHGFVNSIA
tara:strand:- start:2078 stop:2434 length:357 start_codon:yes stop_codon:yes gene_type:complete